MSVGHIIDIVGRIWLVAYLVIASIGIIWGVATFRRRFDRAAQRRRERNRHAIA